MLPKIFVAILAFAGNFIALWYGNFSGRLPAKGAYLGLSYNSVFVRAIVTQFEYIWVLIIINILFTMMFSIGFLSFKNFLTLALIWLAMGPISALVFNAFILREKITWIALVGVLFLIIGSIFVVAQKEILAFFKST